MPGVFTGGLSVGPDRFLFEIEDAVHFSRSRGIDGSDYGTGAAVRARRGDGEGCDFIQSQTVRRELAAALVAAKHQRPCWNRSRHESLWYLLRMENGTGYLPDSY